MPLLGYSDRLSAAPGAELSFFVSASDPGPYSAQLVRFHGIDQSLTPITAREEVIGSAADGEYPGRYQALHTGSYLSIPTPGAPASSGFALTLWCVPTAPGGRTQVLFETEPARDEGRFVLSLDDAGHLQVELTDPAGRLVCLRWPTPVTAGQWIHIQSEVGHDSVRLSVRTAEDESNPDPQRFWVSQHLPQQWSCRPEAITLAATRRGDGCFNGKIENPALYTSITAMNDGGEALAYWDFSRDISTDTVIDRGPHRWHGTLVNRPTRAIVGHAWDRASVRYTDAPAQWNAIHFHDDDLDDAHWNPDFTFSVPDLPSGIYAFRLTQGSQTEYLPFYVLAPTPTAKVLFIAPTNTYAAYASEHLWEGERGEAHAKLMRDPIALDNAEVILENTPGLGRSLYDTHSDGSGVMYATKRRPMVNMRPNYVNWLSAGRRHFSADLFITGWLEDLGIAFDVITEEDLDQQRVDVLRPYDVVVTGSHPEYPTVTEYEALEQYIDGGGNVMYLGANGFYWVTSYTDEQRSGIEVRRGYTSTRNWTSHPAELYHSSTGELGGTWRHRGYDTNPVFGIGMAAVGWAGASGYRRTPDSRDPELKWVFAGVENDTIGEDGFVLGGAAGDELDCADPTRGTPAHARILMSSSHNELYYPAIEVRSEIGPGQDGASNPDVRADVVLIETPGRGSVFSVGSICWAGALAHANYDNDVARVTTNVLEHFLNTTIAR